MMGINFRWYNTTHKLNNEADLTEGDIYCEFNIEIMKFK